MKRNSCRRSTVALAALVIGVATLYSARQLYVSRPGYGLPYEPKFIPDVDDHWTAFGGSWEVVDGSMRNDANDRGAKLLTGSPHWKDYIIEGDMQLLGSG